MACLVPGARVPMRLGASPTALTFVGSSPAALGKNMMLAADPDTGELRRFLTGPIGQEITGVVTTPDQTTMFVNVQHPGASATSADDFARGALASRWPDGGDAYPRSATLAITRNDGGKIGT